MKTIKLTLPLLAVTGLVLAGCPGDDTPIIDDTSSSGTGTTAGPTTNTTPPNPTDPDTTTGETTTVDPDTTAGESSSSGDPVGPYVFDETPYDQYTQVDRMGFPAVNTGLNLLGDKDVYNQASPVEDAELVFLPNIRASLQTLHLGVPMMQTPDNTGLDDDLALLNLTPCSTMPMGMNSCEQQGGPFVIPDTIKISLDGDPGFPNGRQLEAPVMDIILAVLLLDLTVHDITTFIDLDGDGVPGPSLNPLENDLPFDGAFPYLAPPHE